MIPKPSTITGRARIIRWNSGLYNDTKKAIEAFQKYMGRVRDRATGKLPADDAKLEADLLKLDKENNGPVVQ